MIVKSNFLQPIYWRTFVWNDDHRAGGLHDGWIQPGGQHDIKEPRERTFQLELRYGLAGPRSANELMAASLLTQFRDGDRGILITQDGDVERL